MHRRSDSAEARHISAAADVDIGPFRITNTNSQAEAQNESLKWHHEAMRLCLGGLYPCPEVVRSVLAPVVGRTKRILDIGCGNRIWALEMAQEFPHTEVWGWDRPQVQEMWTGEVPNNCRFETAPNYDFLENYEDKFDLIHMRFVAGGCTQFSKTMEDIQTSLRPGGLFILIDSTGDLLYEDGVSLVQMKSSQHPEGIRLQRLFYEVRHASVSMGFDENAMRSTLQEGMWGPDFSRLIDCGAEEVLFPIGPWARSSDPEEESSLKTVGELMKKSINMVRSGHEMVLKRLGFSERTLAAWHDEINKELYNEDLKLLLDTRVLWGRRSSGKTTISSHLPRAVQALQRKLYKGRHDGPSSPLSQTESTLGAKTYRYMRTFKSPTHWQNVTERRRRPNGFAHDPVPFVLRTTIRSRRSRSKEIS